MLSISPTRPSRNRDDAKSSAAETSAQPRTGGPNGLASDTSSACEYKRFTGSGSPRAKAVAAAVNCVLSSSRVMLSLRAEPCYHQSERILPVLLRGRAPRMITPSPKSSYCVEGVNTDSSAFRKPQAGLLDPED